MRARRVVVGTTAGAVIAASLLAGCTAATPVGAPTATVTVTAAPSPSPTPSTRSTSATAAPSPVSTQRGGGKGCSPNGGSIPAGADTAKIGDVDDTDSDATEFYAESPRFEFGVRTASGAVAVLQDGLAGPGAHSGWMARFPLAVLAVLDDGRTATLHAFVDCRFTTVDGVDGEPYRFSLQGFGAVGTGVGCGSYADGTRELLGVDAVRLPDGRYRIDTTEVKVSADGRTATNGTRTRGTHEFTRDSPEVRAANSSGCGTVPIVHTSGH